MAGLATQYVEKMIAQYPVRAHRLAALKKQKEHLERIAQRDEWDPRVKEGCAIFKDLDYSDILNMHYADPAITMAVTAGGANPMAQSIFEERIAQSGEFGAGDFPETTSLMLWPAIQAQREYEQNYFSGAVSRRSDNVPGIFNTRFPYPQYTGLQHPTGTPYKAAIPLALSGIDTPMMVTGNESMIETGSAIMSGIMVAITMTDTYRDYNGTMRAQLAQFDYWYNQQSEYNWMYLLAGTRNIDCGSNGIRDWGYAERTVGDAGSAVIPLPTYQSAGSPHADKYVNVTIGNNVFDLTTIDAIYKTRGRIKDPVTKKPLNLYQNQTVVCSPAKYRQWLQIVDPDWYRVQEQSGGLNGNIMQAKPIKLPNSPLQVWAPFLWDEFVHSDDGLAQLNAARPVGAAAMTVDTVDDFYLVVNMEKLFTHWIPVPDKLEDAGPQNSDLFKQTLAMMRKHVGWQAHCVRDPRYAFANYPVAV